MNGGKKCVSSRTEPTIIGSLAFIGQGVGKHFFNGWVKNSGLSSDTNFHVLAASINASDNATTWLDFVENTQNTNGASNNVNYYMPKQLQFGGWQSKKRIFNWRELAEFVAFDQVLSDEIRKKVEGYLAHKWSLNANLPSGHDYQSESPTGWVPSSESTLQAWFDANDSSTIVSNYVKEWRDSANGNIFLQEEISARPEYIQNGINGMPALNFDGIENFLEISSRFGLNKNPDLMVFAVTAAGLSGVDLTLPDDTISATTNNSPSTQGVEKAIDDDPSTKYLNYDVNNSGLIVTTQVAGVVNGFVLHLRKRYAGKGSCQLCAKWLR